MPLSANPPVRHFAVLIAVFSAAFFVASNAAAQDTAQGAQDPDGPSLEVRTDQVAPWPRFGLSVDLVRPWLGDYRITLHAMPTRFLGARVEAGFRHEAELALVVKTAMDLRPMGRSFDGVLVSVGAEYRQATSERTHELLLVVEAGYSLVWRGLYVSAALGAGHDVMGQRGFRPTGHLSAGWVF